MKIGKYEFDSKEQAKKKIEALNKEDAEGNIIPHNNAIVELGHIVLEQAEYDEDGSLIKEAVLSDKYSVDVMWQDKQAYGWGSYKLDLDGEGIHSFLGVNYLEHKV
jgi:hypothetical protein